MPFKAHHAYLAWSVLVIGTVFLKDGLSADNVTRLLVIGVLGSSLLLYRRLARPSNPKRFFITSGVFLAALVEGAYMISEPVMPKLLVTWDSSLSQMATNYSIDLALTLPVYVLIFWTIWKLLHTFSYSTWEYIMLMAAGQALGDGNAFFLSNPPMLLFIPYIMLNYHAMNVFPFLSIQKDLQGMSRSNSVWKYPVTIAALVTVYLLGGGVIFQVAKFIL